MHNFSGRLVRGIIQYRILIIIAVVLSIAVFGYFNTKIYVDTETMRTVPETLKEKIEFKKLQKTFKTPFILIFIAEFEQGSLTEKIDSITAWSNRFESIIIDSLKGITGTIHIGKIKTPVKGGFFGIQGEYVIPKGKHISEHAIRKRIKDNPEFTKTLITEDESVFGMVLLLNQELGRPLILNQVTKVFKQIDNYSSIKAYLTGASLTSYILNLEMKKDFSILLPLCLIVASILLYFIFRRILYVVASLIIIAIALIWTFGILGITGVPFSIVTSIIPIIMFPVGVANSIHVLKTYSRHRWQNGKDFTDSFTETYVELIRPIVLTSVTTFIGFGSFTFSEISWTRHFGIFTGIGVMLSLFFTVILLPIFVYYESTPKKIKEISKSKLTISEEILNRYRKIIFESPFCKFLILAIIIICITGALLVRFESNPISLFPPNSTIRKSDKLIEKYFSGTRFFYILLTHKQKITKPSQWEEVDSIIHYIKQDENIGDVSSILPLLNKTCTILTDKPISKAGISLLLKAKGLFGKSFKNLINSWITPDRRTTKLTITCKNIPGFKYTNLGDEIKKHITDHYPDWEVQVAGPALLIDSMVFLMIKTQISSITIAFISVFLVLTLLFKSLKIGFLTTLPMILSTATVYALMGLLNVPINMVTVVIVNTCIGIGIDYSIHFTAGYMFIKDNFSNNIDALISNVGNKGAVIMFNTFVVGAGFFVLIFSSFPPVRNFGLFIFISMLVSSSFALIFLPIFFKKYK